MKKSFLILLLTPLLLAGCNENNGENPDPSPEPTPQPQPQPTDPNVVKFVTSGDSFKENFTNGTQFTSGHSENVSKLTTFLNNQTNEADSIISLECVSLNCLDDLNKDGNRYLTIGSAKANGSLVINTKHAVSAVNVECTNYNNTYNNYTGGYNCDRNAHLHIDDKDFSLELGETEEPSFHEFDVQYVNPVNSFTLSSVSGRIFIKSITVTYSK